MATTNPNTIIGHNKSRILADPGNVKRFPDADIPYRMLINFSEYSYTASAALISNSDNSSKRTPAGSIILPLPLQLNDSTNVNASVTSGTNLAMLKRAYDVAGGVDSLNTIGQDDFVLYGELLSNALLAAGVSAAKVSKTITGKIVGAAVGAAGGILAAATSDTVLNFNCIAKNPFETLQFKGVDLKRHSFTWTLSPSSAKESDTLRDIITKIKANILPSYRDPTIKDVHALLKYPAVASISFYGIDQDYYYRLKPSMITSLDVNYNGSDQLNVYRGGKPAVITMRMELTELTIHTSDDYGGSTASVSSEFDANKLQATVNTANALGF